MSATWLAPWLIHEFAAFTASWPVKPGSRSLSRANLKSATWLAQAGSHFFSERQVSRVCSGGLAESLMQISFIWRKCDLPYVGRVALWVSGSEGRKKSNK